MCIRDSDLKTPITVIQGYAKAVRDGLVPPEKVPDYLDIIQQKANRLTDLIESFHEYSKLEHPQFTLHTEPMDLCEVLREYLAGKYSELELAGFVPQIDKMCIRDRKKDRHPGAARGVPVFLLFFQTFTNLKADVKAA